MLAEEAQAILDDADLIVDARTIQEAVARLATEISAQLSSSHPLLVSVMGGAVIFTGHLLPQLRFPLDFDYVHATRYGSAIAGGALQWVVEPRIPVAGRTVLLVDDILDEGITLAAIRQHLLNGGATRCLTVVLADKAIGREKPITADFVGVTLPNRYVFGYGMDVRGAWRNLPDIYAVKE